ncbi:hypothetical protein Q4E93_22945 [Flavitalea sp. BT771]|uniref:hypothetical protein n=1 Tax=Flavitalea sp. BT771 TaxID=3063329 RepID=UPI0026E274B0|nr:hypothetical protein [Flavitalea sp. BT771]MDO6433489.1 hypothetical protein [Flavitalea sp. BT771]MDV6222606.1 hypothetical protein [Flavitalea sp. BT771]
MQLADLIAGIRDTFLVFYLTKLGLHFYLDLSREEYDIMVVTRFDSRKSQLLHYYKQKESGARNIMKGICNVCFSISLFLLVLWMFFGLGDMINALNAPVKVSQ